MNIINIKSQESALTRVAHDTYFPTVFGSIHFEIDGVEFFASTVDRWADNIFINTDTMVPLVPNSVRTEVCKFFQKIWDMKEVENIQIPQLILSQIPSVTAM